MCMYIEIDLGREINRWKSERKEDMLRKRGDEGGIQRERESN